MPRTIFENIVIQHFENQASFEYCPYTAIRFFEILFIEKGNGKLIVNGHSIPYSDNQLFILVPNDKYTFNVEQATTVNTIKFLNSFFTGSSEDNDDKQRKEWFKKIETILHSTNRNTNIELKSEAERNNILAMFNIICIEYHDQELKSDLILKNTLHSILHIISRNVNYVSIKTASSKIQEIVNYIHTNIYDADLISNTAIAEQFNISDNYVGQYFNKQMGISIKKYILTYKVKLAETRLNYTDLTLSEIAMELGFTDSSHLDKTFIAYKGLAAGAFRLQSKNK
ncbi:AraC family transcriptional regulator [Labilibacter marinus]|uniref:AraC family transcriptional regulator n=1 Tax=Labilibacter marinus TaxID=1477105 RepID=UPI0009500398|nr:AraC family transcriptional regulator [Labilibacter marinus]